MKTLTADQRQIMIDRLQTNLYTHGMRSQLFREMRNKFIREQRAEAQASVFNKMLEDKNMYVCKCVLCGSPMPMRRSTKRTCSSRCRTQLSRLQRATAAAQRRAQEERENGHRLNRLPRAERRSMGEDGRFVLVN
jgi:ferredoxin